MQNKLFQHPNPNLQRLWHFATAGLIMVMLISVPLQIWLAISLGSGAFVVSAVLVLLLVAPLMMVITATPAIELDQSGIRLRPHIWGEAHIPWQAITRVKRYPLLPDRNQEVGRRVMVGRKRYREAAGIMLVAPSLPWQYRVTGYFTGEAGKPIIAITNRTHTDYDRLTDYVLKRVPPAAIDEAIKKS